jgi:hypothetical protein
MIAYFDGLLDIRHSHDIQKCMQLSRPLTSTIPYILPWKNVYITLPNPQITHEYLLHALNGTIVGLLSSHKLLAPPTEDQHLLCLCEIPLVPCVGLGNDVENNFFF